ncbi:MAG: ATP-binding cassette domain-containing protein [Actinomycetota bacterium]
MTDPPVPAAQLTDATVRYRTVDAVLGLDLTVGPGERVALVGASGAGKSTLLGLLTGLVPPSSGRVDVLGRRLGELRGRHLRAHRARIGSVSQQLDLALPLRVVHNVNAGRLGRWSTAAALASLARPTGRSEVVAVLDAVGLADRVDARTDELSGGERQRVAVARVLRQRPELVLADEPTASIDPRLADQVMELLCGPRNQAPWTTIVSVHDPALARRHADRLVGMAGGRIVFDRPPDHVNDEELAALYRRTG